MTLLQGPKDPVLPTLILHTVTITHLESICMKKVNEIVENYHSNPTYCKHEQKDKEFHNKPSLFVNDK